MAIDITCPGCKTRFQVSEKFAGKQGPCPKCKTVITIPALKDQVVIHSPELEGPKDSKGQLVLKPILRKETRLSAVQIVAIIGGVVVVLLVALFLGITYEDVPDKDFPPVILIVGSILLAPFLSFAGYTFLRDGELEPYRGFEIVLRLVPTAIVYPGMWGLFWFVFWYWGYEDTRLDLFHYGMAIPILVAIGAFAAHLSLDLEPVQAAFHCGMYLTATVVLRLILGLPAAWTVVEKATGSR